MVHGILNQITTSPQKEDIFVKLVGHLGRWQLLVFSSVSLVKLSSGWVQMAILFLTPKSIFWCVEFENGTREVENSTCYDGCLKYEYDTSPFDNTIVSQWGLVCERAWLASFTQMVLQLGVLIGSIVFGFLSDRYGRKNTFLVSIVLLIAFGFGVPFSPNYTIFTIQRFCLGMATAGTMVISFVLVMEAMGPRYREVFGCMFQLPFIVGHMTVPVFAYYFRSWDTYSLAMAVPALIYLGYFWLVSESPRWLVSVGKVDEATIIVTKAALMNNLPTANIKESLTKMSLEINSRADEPRLNYSALFWRPLRLRTACTCWMWLVGGFIFFGFNQYISQTSSDPFISVATAGAIQIPANFISIWMISQFGRRLTISACFCLSGACILALGGVSGFWPSLALGSLGVSFAAIVATAYYVYTSELYPTVVRNMAMGAASTSMRVGSMIAPFVSNLNGSIPWLPTVIFGVVPILTGVVILLLPETKGRPLPDSLDDVNEEK